jgi:hypothetical protein
MSKTFPERLTSESISSRALLIIALSAIGLTYALATILGVMGAQRTAAPDLPVPKEIAGGLFIGTAIWATLTGFSSRSADRNRSISIKGQIPFGWLVICFITCTAIPVIYTLGQTGERLTFLWGRFIQICFFSAFSFGVSGVIIGLTAILLHLFFWHLLAGLKWGSLVTCAMGFFLGLSAGWAAYGWTVFSSQALFTLTPSF